MTLADDPDGMALVSQERRAAVSTPTSVVTVTAPAPPGAWEELVTRDGGAVPSQSMAWRDCVCADGTYVDASRLYEFGGGRRILLPLVRRKAVSPRVAHHASWPKEWGVGGPITPCGSVRSDEARSVLTDLAKHGGLSARLRLRHGSDPAWTAEAQGFRVVPHSMQVVDLAGGFARVWAQRFSRSARGAVRKAEASGIDVEVAKADEALAVYDALAESSVARWARQQHEPVRLTRWRWRRDAERVPMALVARRFGENCHTWVARYRGTPVAVVVVLYAGEYAKAWKAVMDKDLAGPVRAVDLLHRLIVENACDQGLRAYDLGESRPGSSLERFKLKLGAATYSAPELITERFPVISAHDLARGVVKRAIGFVDY
jgi:hypothetical protein